VLTTRLVPFFSLCLVAACSFDSSVEVPGLGTEKADEPAGLVLEGEYVERFIGEFDPVLIGDTCLTYVRVTAEDGDYAPGLYGIAEDMLDCSIAMSLGENPQPGMAVSIDTGLFDSVARGEILDELQSFKEATYFEVLDFLRDDLAEVAELPEGVASTGLAQIGLMNVLFDDDHTNPRLIEDLVLFGKDNFGNECDLVPESRDELELEKNDTVEGFLFFLRVLAADWEGTLSSEQVDALEAWFDEAGHENIHVFFGRKSGDACGGEGSVSYNLVFNSATHQAMYLVLFPYTE
jgi:hypothetical protein